MTTRVIRREEASPTGIIAMVAVVILIVAGFIAYNQGFFGTTNNSTSAALPPGQMLSESVQER